MAGVVDVTGDSEDDIADVVDVISDSGDEGGAPRVRSGAPPARFHGYRRGRELGQGSSGRVYVCTRKGCTGAFAAKAVDLRRMQMSSNAEREQTALCREVEILKSLPPHPNVVRLFDAFEEGDWFLLILELVGGGDLYTVLTSRDTGRFLEPEATFVLRQLADGLSFLHGRSIIHRDLKLENVLVASERRERRTRPLVLYNVKITDFGLSKAVGAGLSMAHSLVGTHPYTAPEVLAGGNYDFSSDLWCLGVLLYVLLAGHFPFDHTATSQEELDMLADNLINSSKAQSLVSGLLQLDPTARLTMEALHKHDWLAEDSAAASDTLARPMKRQCKAPPPRDACKSPPAADVTASTPRAATTPAIELAESQEPNADAAAIWPAASPESVLSVPENHDSAPADYVVDDSPVGRGPQVVGAAPCEASGVGEWLACIYRAHRNISGVGTLGEALGSTGMSADQELLQLPVVAEQPEAMQVFVAVPVRLAQAVLGKACAQMKQVASTVGCKLQVLSREGLGTQLLVLLGSYNQCSIVQELVNSRLMDALRVAGSEPVDHTELMLLVRTEAAGVVIGKQGFMLEQIRKRSGATVKLLREQLHGQRPCILTGPAQDVLRAERHVFDLVRAVPVAKRPSLTANGTS